MLMKLSHVDRTFDHKVFLTGGVDSDVAGALFTIKAIRDPHRPIITVIQAGSGDHSSHHPRAKALLDEIAADFTVNSLANQSRATDLGEVGDARLVGTADKANLLR